MFFCFLGIKSMNLVSHLLDQKTWRWCVWSIFPAGSVLLMMFLLWTSLLSSNYQSVLPGLQAASILPGCKSQCRPNGSEVLPEGIVSKTSNLQMRPLWGFPKTHNSSISLLAMPVGAKQQDLVDKMVQKFLSRRFVVMLFHYDGIVDDWNKFNWSNSVIHVSATKQTKWWFAKRFLHPDIVSEYDYIFIWDEDLGVENFDPQKYVTVVRREGLEISQPALDPKKSEVHHQITARRRKSKVHRRTYKRGDHGCDKNSNAPPCTGWIEMMAPVFSRAAWRCAWYMIQNDLIHAWGLDVQLGYCAQGDRTRNIGVVDSQYIVHYGRPTLGGTKPPSVSRQHDPRVEVRRQSYIEYKLFKERWSKAVEDDKCWVDPY